MTMYHTADGCEPYDPYSEAPREVCQSCGDDLLPGEAAICPACAPCHRCCMPCGDPEPPMVHGEPVCDVCFYRHLCDPFDDEDD